MEWIDSEDTDKISSLETTRLGELFQSEQFPITTEELIEKFGDEEVQYPRGSERLELILKTSGMENYETLDDLELAIQNGVSRDAVGRPRYSDRGDEYLEAMDDRIDQSF